MWQAAVSVEQCPLSAICLLLTRCPERGREGVRGDLYPPLNSQLAWPLNKRLENNTHIWCDFLSLSTVHATTPLVLYIECFGVFFMKSNKMNYVYDSSQVKRVRYNLNR